jgi:hypothetical protein
MNYYSPEQVQAAVKVGTITPQDAEYMLQEQRPGLMAGQGDNLFTDRDAALRLLVDPNTPDKLRKSLLASLKQFDSVNPPAEMKYGAGSPWGAWLGTGLGALALGALGAKSNKNKLSNMLGLDDSVPVGSYRDKLGNFINGENADLGLGALGALAGGGIGGTVGSYIAPARKSPYENPLGD